MSDPVEQLRASRRAVEEAVKRLISPSPDALDCCSSLLQEAVRLLRDCRPGLRPGIPSAREALSESRALRRSLYHAGRLLQAASVYHRRWHEILCAMTEGYTVHGQPASLSGASRISVRG